MEFRLTEIAKLLGLMAPSDPLITGWSTDTRSISPGDLFIALRGPNHNGNAYVGQAFRQGAASAIADERRPGWASDYPILLVPDSLVALQSVAAWARREWSGEVVGVT